METSAEKIKLLQEEIFTKQQELSALKLSQVPEKISNYSFKDKQGNETTLLDLFEDKEELLLIHNMGKACVYCTMWADAFNGMHHIIRDRVKIVLTSPDKVEVMKEFSEARGWTLPIYSYAGSNFANDLGFAHDKNDRRWYSPGVSALILKDGEIYRTASDSFGPGDVYCAPWHLFNLLPEGNKGWEPKYKY